MEEASNNSHEESTQDEALWDLMGQAREHQASPFFVRNVLREIRMQSAPRQFSWVALLRWALPVGACAAALLWAATAGQGTQEDQSGFNSEFDALADLSSLVSQDDSSLWIGMN